MNASLTSLPGSDPAQILRFRDRQNAAELLVVAIAHFDMFTWLRDHPGVNTTELCDHFQVKERPADVLLTLCRAGGFITTDRDDKHHLTTVAQEHLVSDSPWFLGPYYTMLKDSPVVQGFLKVLRTGKPANWEASEDGDDWHQSMLSDEFARNFTELMNCRGLAMGQMLAQKASSFLANRKRILDVGGGSGIYATTMAAAHPHLTGMVLEQPPVDKIAREEIARNKVQDRLEVVSGDMFKSEWPEGSDILLLSNVLHDWDMPEVRKLLEKSHSYLPSDGLLIIHEAFLNNDKTGPLPVAEYSTLLMSISQGKCYTPDEYGQILKDLGFEVGLCVDTIADRGFMTAVKK